MNLRDLEYIAAIDRYRNFGRAANACHVSQPSLSAQVKKLEERLGVELFARNNAGVITTDAGARIVVMAREMLRSAQRMSDTAAEYHDPLAAPLRIGMIPTLGPFVLPYISKTIRSVAEGMNIIFREQPTEALWSELESRMVDVAMMSGPVLPAGYRFTPVFKEPLVLMVSKSHRLANADSVSPCDIPVEELLLMSSDHCLRADTLSLCNDKNVGIDVPDQLLATNLVTISHFLTEGVGCTLVPILAQPILECANREVAFVRVDDASYARDIGFVSRKGCPREHILMSLCDEIRANPPEHVTTMN